MATHVRSLLFTLAALAALGGHVHASERGRPVLEAASCAVDVSGQLLSPVPEPPKGTNAAQLTAFEKAPSTYADTTWAGAEILYERARELFREFVQGKLHDRGGDFTYFEQLARTLDRRFELKDSRIQENPERLRKESFVRIALEGALEARQTAVATAPSRTARKESIAAQTQSLEAAMEERRVSDRYLNEPFWNYHSKALSYLKEARKH